MQPMDPEIVSLRVLIVTPSPSLRTLLRQAAGQASLPAEVHEAHSAIAAEAQIMRGSDLVLLDGGMPASEQVRVCRAAAEAEEPPFVILVGGDHGEADIAGRIDKPADAGAAQRAVNRCIRASMPQRALIVDDSPTMRAIVRKILAATTFTLELTETGDGEKALRLLRGGDFDLVFLDCNMPGLDGFQVLAELGGAQSRAAVVMITSTDNPAMAERARLAGAAAFLKKPFFPADVDSVLYRMHKIQPPVRIRPAPVR